MRNYKNMNDIFEAMFAEQERQQGSDGATKVFNKERLKNKGEFIETSPGSNVARCNPNLEYAGCEIIECEFTVIK